MLSPSPLVPAKSWAKAGGEPKATVTVKLQQLDWPQESVAQQVTVLVPIGNMPRWAAHS